MTIKNDAKHCMGCKRCAKTCIGMRGGVMHLNLVTSKLECICNICDDNSSCVKNYPFGALSFMGIPIDRQLADLASAGAAERLVEQLYNLNV